MRTKTDREKRVGRRNMVAGVLFGIIVATVAGAWATTTFKKMTKGKPATAADVNQAHQDLADAIDKLKSEVNTQAKTLTAQAAKIAKLETDPDCPPGYLRDSTAPASITLCKKGLDEMVKVGDFWVDRYESSIVDANTWAKGKCSGVGTRCGKGQCGAGTKDDYPPGFPDNAKVNTVLYACSRKGNVPSKLMTWFQAAAACALAGKNLCTNEQWQVAASGTPNDSISCNVTAPGAELAGHRKACVSMLSPRMIFCSGMRRMPFSKPAKPHCAA